MTIDTKDIQQRIILLLKLAYTATNAATIGNALQEANQQLTCLQQQVHQVEADSVDALTEFIQNAFNINLQLLKGLDAMSLYPVDQVRKQIEQLERVI
ncbi:MAG: hypothetical protein LKF36_03975 [Lactobacillus sp.]|jgi:chemotaxis signal transduction protein|nr:hypothetical protein [Lactobacillus sp.]